MLQNQSRQKTFESCVLGKKDEMRQACHWSREGESNKERKREGGDALLVLASFCSVEKKELGLKGQKFHW